jgi:hypothetical protein
VLVVSASVEGVATRGVETVGANVVNDSVAVVGVTMTLPPPPVM